MKRVLIILEDLIVLALLAGVVLTSFILEIGE